MKWIGQPVAEIYPIDI